MGKRVLVSSGNHTRACRNSKRENSSTIDLSAGIKLKPLQCRRNAKNLTRASIIFMFFESPFSLVADSTKEEKR